ncbi:hypothetical protein VOM14_16240 [Paraburkholderia sp. MPAMCS5]|uniref:GFA family protein n=1 Tax=Paraburkholderia sp. MPAMCS5 TaxID=3112563 RepID=UPI002E17249C|nr:hypothetical protein [Paraburkholderia sp. MPAMCS5]
MTYLSDAKVMSDSMIFELQCTYQSPDWKWGLEEISAFLKEMPIEAAREIVSRLVEKDKNDPCLELQCRKNLFAWLSDNPEEIVIVPIGASCACGAVHLSVEVAPSELERCDCPTCRRYGALWAEYGEQDVLFAVDNGETEGYIGMCNGRPLTFHRCRVCGGVTHWRAMDGRKPSVGVNALMMEPEAIEDARIFE